ncbi:Uncharacterized protein TCAP_05066 [Tolypocladium capitatum]|uniref:Myb/SANT-like domain-containing protein n=1 Tax=Tolypocladium capitatum TaxID=45235 RepID=A0A2K3QBT9_9HYPO|nr:Uncharacterized protein TCAP_05066 [Tolypocladium capitatum]
MSEDDVDMLGPDGQGSTRVDRDRRAPRFSWTPAYEATFFRSLCDSVQLGLRENSSFKAEAWERAAQALQESHSAYPAKSHLINKSDNARKRFRLWRGLRENPEFLYSPITRTVTATEEAWRAHIEREPLSRALRGRPFDHEDFMEILYPDVIGSGGAPKRIMKPRRRTDGQPGDETDMPGTGILNLLSDPAPGQAIDSPEGRRASPSQTPTGSATGPAAHSRPTSAAMPPRTVAVCLTSALTPPDETPNQAKKRALPPGPADGPFETSPSSSTTPSGSLLQSAASPEKRQRTSIHGDTLPSTTGSTLNSSATAPSSANTTPLSGTDGPILSNQQCSHAAYALDARSDLRWQEAALDLFFKEFADQDLDLQSARVLQDALAGEAALGEEARGSAVMHSAVRSDQSRAVQLRSRRTVEAHWNEQSQGIRPGTIVLNGASYPALRGVDVALTGNGTGNGAPPPTSSKRNAEPEAVSYADVAASGPKQSPQEVSARPRDAAAHHHAGAKHHGPLEAMSDRVPQAAAPQPPEVVHDESALTASLVDVDVIRSVHTVPSDFLEQDIMAETHADGEADAAKAQPERPKKDATKKPRRAHSWLTSQFSKLSDGDASALAVANIAAVIGISSWLGYRAWGLYENGRMDWKAVGVGLGILTGVGAVESLFGGYLYKGTKGSPEERS